MELIHRRYTRLFVGPSIAAVIGTAVIFAGFATADATSRPAVSVSHTAELALPFASSGSGSNLGASAALSADGKTAVLGAPLRKVYNRRSGEGDAYILTSKGWSGGSELNLGAPAGNESFIGQSAAVSGDGKTALIGAPLRAIVGAGRAGAAYLYPRSGNSWGTASP
jgi:hypothetical protein